MERLSVHEYFRLPETMRPMELVYGVVREPPAPRYGPQSIVTRLTALLFAHVEGHRLGRLCVSPVDVVLDELAALVVQPDLIFISNESLGIERGSNLGPARSRGRSVVGADCRARSNDQAGMVSTVRRA